MNLSLLTPSFLIMAIVGAADTQSARAGEFDARARAEFEQIRREMRESEDAHFMAESQQISLRLAALNNTSVSFDPSARTSPSSAGEDVVSGEWRLGNGGVCIRTVWTSSVICRGGIGFSLKASKKMTRKR